MATIDQDIVGGRELDRLLQTLPVGIERNIMRSALRAGGVVLREKAKQYVPRDDGDLFRSIRVTSRVRRGQVQIGVKAGNSQVYYAGMVEYGTRPHYVAVSDVDRGPGRGRGRRGTAGRQETLASIRTVNKRVLQIGANFVGPSVHHPGSQAHPFMRPAVDAGFRPAVAAVQAQVRKLLNKNGIRTPAPVPTDQEE